jgi:hypothetical protein
MHRHLRRKIRLARHGDLDACVLFIRLQRAVGFDTQAWSDLCKDINLNTFRSIVSGIVNQAMAGNRAAARLVLEMARRDEKVNPLADVLDRLDLTSEDWKRIVCVARR